MARRLPVMVLEEGGSRVASRRRVRSGCRAWHPSRFLALTTYAILSLRVAGFSTSGDVRLGCQRQRQQQHRWDERRRCHVTRRSGTARARAARMVATEGPSRLSIPQQPESSSGGPAAAATSVSKAGPEADAAGVARAHRLRVATFFFFWYTFNVGYNLCTKFTPTAMPLPVTLAAIQLLVGVPYAWTLWLTGLRKAPKFSLSKLKGAAPVAMAHTMAHLAAVVSIGAGAVGFVQIVKGAEPLFTSFLSFLAGSAMPWQVYTTLLPVIGGVAMASAGEISFSFLAFGAAMTSNASAASRSVLGKLFMAKEKQNGGVMDAGNLYAVMTMLGCLVLTPAALLIEGPKVAGVWNAALSAGHSQRSLLKNIFLSGFFFYLYNEVSFYALNIIHPVTHALGNSLKRVVMIAVSVVVLNHKFTPLGLAGCTTAIGGVMAYSITKARLETIGVVV
ncbi:unnamed protein product, partial [Scytosiphon promiscuus]